MSQRAMGRILVVDDTEANRYALGLMLRGIGFEVTEAATGEEALRLAARERPDLIVLDVRLPDIDGYEVCRRLKSDAATSDVPVLHVSANFVTAEAQARGIENGAEGYLCQPVNPSMLAATVKSLVRARRAEAALRESEERFRAMSDELPLIVWVHGPDGKQQFVNRTFCEFFGVSREEMREGRWQLLMHPEDAAGYTNEFMACVRERRPFHGEVRVRRADGAWRTIESWARPRLSGGGGEFLGFVGTSADVTERHGAEEALRQAKEEAERANSAKDQFLAVLSHELRTPLTPVVMSVAALEVEPGLPHGVREELAMIRRNISLETRLIDDLLDLSRVMNGKMTLHAERVGVHPLLNAATDILTSEVESKRIELVWRLEAEDDEVNADAARLQQVFWNLVKNAVKFTPEGGTITVRTWNPGPRQIAVEVADTGKGIDPAALPRIFNAFDQGERAVNRSFGGLGLGLTISKAIVEMHGGGIRAESDGAGRGARFTVELATTGPVTKLVDRIERRAAGGGGGAGALRVLLVEDHMDTLRTMRRLMENMGFAVTAASTVGAALRLVGAQEFDVLVSDIGLPDATGLELMRQIRNRGMTLPGVALTGYGMESDIRSTREVGFDAHLTKPVDVSHLAATVRRLAKPRDASVEREASRTDP